MIEIWKQTKQHEDYYVSNLGRVKREKRVLKVWNRFQLADRIYQKKYLSLELIKMDTT